MGSSEHWVVTPALEDTENVQLNVLRRDVGVQQKMAHISDF